jgi:hypothetical protein
MSSEPPGPLPLTSPAVQPVLSPSQWIENPSYSPESTSQPMEFFSARSDPSSSAPSGYQSSISFNPHPVRAHQQATDHNIHHVAIPPAPPAPTRDRNPPRAMEPSYREVVPFQLGIHAGATKVPYVQPSPPHVIAAPPSHPPCREGVSNQRPLQVASTSHLPQPPLATYPLPSHVSGEAPRPQQSYAGALPQPSTYLPLDHQREVHDREPPQYIGYVPSASTSNISYVEDQTHKLNGTKNSLDAKSVPTFCPRKGLISNYKYSQVLSN